MSSGAKKAAFLLKSLDPPTAAELLKAARPELITEIAAELAYLNSTGEGTQANPGEFVMEFFGLVRGSRKRVDSGQFIKEILEHSVGPEQSQRIMGQVHDKLEARDPFRRVRSADINKIAKALEGESAQVASIVLAELPPAKSAAMLSLLDESIRTETLRSMTGADDVSLRIKLRVAAVVRQRLQSMDSDSDSSGPAANKREQKIRKVAILLRSLGQEFRDDLIAKLVDSDSDTGALVQKQMVLWEDLVLIADRSLQETLRQVDSKTLAIALVDADEKTANKIRSNMSERANAALEEEASLISSVKPEETLQARETVLDSLREMNSKGELSLEEVQENAA